MTSELRRQFIGFLSLLDIHKCNHVHSSRQNAGDPECENRIRLDPAYQTWTVVSLRSFQKSSYCSSLTPKPKMSWLISVDLRQAGTGYITTKVNWLVRWLSDWRYHRAFCQGSGPMTSGNHAERCNFSRMLAQALSLTIGSQKKEKRANSTVTNALDQLAWGGSNHCRSSESRVKHITCIPGLAYAFLDTVWLPVYNIGVACYSPLTCE